VLSACAYTPLTVASVKVREARVHCFWVIYACLVWFKLLMLDICCWSCVNMLLVLLEWLESGLTRRGTCGFC